VPDPSRYTLWLDLDLSSSASADYYDRAWALWTSVVVGDINGGGVTDTTGIDTEQGPAGIPNVLDDTYISGADICLDGPGKVLGRAAPLLTYRSTGLPATGMMEFDREDVPRLGAKFEATVLHEMAHVLGIGSLWSRFVDTNFDYQGSNAVNVWQNVWGCSGNPPIEQDGGPGTAGGHWDELVLDNELMTGFLNDFGPNPLSLLTTAALKDLGYQVDDGLADTTVSEEKQKGRGVVSLHMTLSSLTSDLIIMFVCFSLLQYCPPLAFCACNNLVVRKLLQSSPPPPLSEEGLAAARAYGLSSLDAARDDCASTNCWNNLQDTDLVFVGDKATMVLYEENDRIYEVFVTADDR
jgi:Leishmanolysin